MANTVSTQQHFQASLFLIQKELEAAKHTEWPEDQLHHTLEALDALFQLHAQLEFYDAKKSAGAKATEGRKE